MTKVKTSVLFFLLIVIFAALTLADGTSAKKIYSILILALMLFCLRAISGVGNLQELMVWVKNKKGLVLQFFTACIGFGLFIFSMRDRDPYLTYTYAISIYIFALVFFATLSVVIDRFTSQKK
jgi:hypothetical protein